MNNQCRETRSIGASNSFSHKWSAAQEKSERQQKASSIMRGDSAVVLLSNCQTKDDTAMIVEKNGKDM